MVTINDIAKHTGLSRSTVAAVLSGRAEALRIRDATCEVVKEAAGRLGYSRNSLAYQMVTGTTDVIGFLCEDLGATEYTGSILSGVMRKAADNGYYVKIFPYSKGGAAKALADIIGQRPAGVIAFAVIPPDFEPLFDGLAKVGIPLLSLNDVKADRGLFVVTADADGVAAVVGHLHSLGHRKIGFFTTRKSMELNEPRTEGFLRGVAGHGLSEAEIIPELLDSPDLETLVLLVAAKSYTAIACGTDYDAMRVLQAAAKVGVKVPAQLSVVGFADVFAASLCAPPLTTARQPFAQWGAAAARRLLEVVNTKAKPFLTEKIVEKIAVELIVRESTAPPFQDRTNITEEALQ